MVVLKQNRILKQKQREEVMFGIYCFQAHLERIRLSPIGPLFGDDLIPNRSSRFYQNWLLFLSRFYFIFLYLGGIFSDRDNFLEMTVMLFISVYLGVRIRGTTFNRSRLIKKEVDRKVKNSNKAATYYQKILQWLGASKEIFIFFIGKLQNEFFLISFLLFLVHIVSGVFISELRFRREQSTYHGK